MIKTSMNPLHPIIGITSGDPAGIGPEVIIKALSQRTLSGDYKIIGTPGVFKDLGYTGADNVSFVPIEADKKTLTVGQPNHDSALLSLRYLQTAVELLKRQEIHALVTGPVSKEAITGLGKKFQGHTEFLAQAFGVKKYEMMFVSNKLRVVIVTRHIPIKDLCRIVTKEKIYDAISMTHSALKEFFKIPAPQIAVCGLNPHAGEGGHIGKEEIQKIIPAIEKAKKRGIHVLGPFPADTLFSPKTSASYDCVIAMYHDQGLIPIKTLYFQDVVNMTIGLPFIRTSPAHGTGFNIAGKNKADPSSMAAAIELAAKLSSRYTSCNNPHAAKIRS